MTCLNNIYEFSLKTNIWKGSCQTVQAKSQIYNALTSVCYLMDDCLTAF